MHGRAEEPLKECVVKFPGNPRTLHEPLFKAEIELAGYSIIANVGDQPSDLLGGHSERDFLLPDPFYRVP